MKVRKVYQLQAFLAVLFILLYSSVNLVNGISIDALHFDPSIVNVSLHTNQKTSVPIKLMNTSSNFVFFSLVKSAEKASFSVTNQENSVLSNEFGSTWQTYKCNYRRQSFNPVESAIPPYNFKWSFQGNKPLMPPVVTGDFLYIPSEDGFVYIIDSRTGVYRNRLTIDFPVVSLHLSDIYLIIVTTQELVVYNRSTQIYLWRKPLQFYSSASIVVQNNTIFFLDGTYLVSANVITGNENWKISNTDQFVLLTDDLLITSNEEHMLAYQIETGKLLWKINEQKLIDIPSEMNQRIYYIHQENQQSFISALYFDGKKDWTQPLSYPDLNFYSVNYSNIVLTSISGSIICLDIYTGKQKWKYQHESKIHTAPVISAGYIYIASNNGSVFTLDLANGSLVWQTNTSFPVYNPLVIAKGFIYVTDAVNNLYAYGREWENVIPPEPPDQLKAISDNQRVTLFWRHAKQTPDFAGYHIYRKTIHDVEYSFIASVGIINQYQDTGLKNKLEYHYIVRSFDTFGNESTNSNMISAIPEESVTPNWFLFDPTGGSIKPNDFFAVNLQFITNDLIPGNFTAFLHCLYSDESQETNIVSLTINLHIAEKNETILPIPKISSIGASDTRVNIKWEPVSLASSYFIYRSVVKNDELKLVYSAPSNVFNFQDDQVTNHKTYFYYLKYETADHLMSDYSLEVSVTPKPLPIAILYPTTPTLYDPVFTVQGKADPKAHVYYRNWELTLDSEGKFTTTVGINVGWNKLLFYAVDTSGVTQEVILEVQFVTSSLVIELTIGSPIVHINQKTWPYQLDVVPMIVNNRTFIPLRFISEVIGAQVEWDGKEQRIDIIKGSQTIVLWIGKTEAKLNNKMIKLESSPFLFHNRTMVPLRFVTEPLGAELQWNAAKQTITLIFKA